MPRPREYKDFREEFSRLRLQHPQKLAIELCLITVVAVVVILN